MIKNIIISILAIVLLSSCHKDSAIEIKADEFCKHIIEDFKKGDTKQAEHDVKAMNEYARSLTDEHLEIFMARYETHTNEIAEAAAQNVANAMQQASKELDNDSMAILRPNGEKIDQDTISSN